MALGARHGLAVATAAVVSVVAWWVLREQLTLVLGAVARTLVALGGYATHDARPDTLAIMVARGADGTSLVRGTTLERWHVNLTLVPILVVALGPATWRRRAAIGVTGLGLVLLCDAVLAIAFVLLQASGGDPGMRQTAMRGLAVYGSKLVPFVVGGVLIVIASWGSRRLGRPAEEDT